MNRKKNPQLKIMWNKSSTLILLTYVTFRLKNRDGGWHTLTVYKLKVYNVENLVDGLFYDSKIGEGFCH